MNNKEFINALSAHVGMDGKETQRLVKRFTAELADRLDESRVLSVQGFGQFEVRKKLERIVVNPASRQRMLVPPKLVLNFKPSNVLKEKFNK